MPYIFIVIAIGGFLSGFGVSYQISKAEIQEMSNGIDALHREAEATIATLTAQADNAHANALNTNKQLEDANVSAIKAINSQHDAFKSQRMYDTNRKSNSCTTTAGTNTAGTANTATQYAPELSTELTEFLKSESYRADEITNYAILCKQFVIDNNCTIQK